MSTDLRWSSFETWNKFMNLPFLWRYPILYTRGTRGFRFLPHSKKDTLITIVGETLVCLIAILGSCSLLLVEVLTGHSFGLLANLCLIVISLTASFSTTFSLVMFYNRELFASLTRHIVHLELLLSSSKIFSVRKIIRLL
jgi:hypothetical protein